MQKLEAAVTLMEKILNEVDFLVGECPDSILDLEKIQSFEIFSKEALDFLSDLSKTLLSDKEVKKFPDVASFAFFCRYGNLNQLKNHYNSNFRIGKGILFHITPSNVPVNFAYSLVTGIISGNINIVRVPSKDFNQVTLIINALNIVLQQEKHKRNFYNRIFLVKYNRDSQATLIFSSICDIRIIWGGDQTINDIRKSPIPPKSTEVTFSDRYSIAVIDSENYIKCDFKERLALDFYNDTYLFDQNACTSPQTIFWNGNSENIKIAQKFFWDCLVNVLIEKKYYQHDVISIDKLTTFYSQAIFYGDIEKVPNDSNQLWRIHNHILRQGIENFKSNSGYFNEVFISSLSEITKFVSRKYQTVGYFGFDKSEIHEVMVKTKPIGIDRFVKIGKTMDFDLIWDGIDLVYSFSRVISIK